MPAGRLLVVDDTMVIRRIVMGFLTEAGYAVTGARDGQDCLDALAKDGADLVVLDVEMPGLDGLATCKQIGRTYRDLPVIMFSAHTEKGAEITLQALYSGASDYLIKPSGLADREQVKDYLRTQLLPKIEQLLAEKAAKGGLLDAGAGVSPASAAPAAPSAPAPQARPAALLPAHPAPTAPAAPAALAAPARSSPAEVMARLRQQRSRDVKLVAIGVSTGGPKALEVVIGGLPRNFSVPVVVVQHMPAFFTKSLAECLTAKAQLLVKEAEHGETLVAGRVYIAPGEKHMKVSPTQAGGFTISLDDGPAVNFCKPAVDVLFGSLAKHELGPVTVALILTGMGSDGLEGCKKLKAQGSTVLAQDRETSVVWGMPGFVAKEPGLADAVLPLGDVAGELVRRVPAGKIQAALGPI